MSENFVAEFFSLLGIALLVISLRIAARISLLGVRRLQLDDYLMLLAGCLYSAETVAAYYVLVYQGLTIGSMTPEQRATLDPDSQEYHYRVWGSKTQLMGWVVYTVLLWTLKTCMLVFYSRLTDNVSNMAIRIKIGIFVLPITFLAVVCVILFGCSPVQKHWQVYPDPGGVCYPAHSFPSLYTLIVLNVSTDFYLMYIPLPMILKARLPTKKKIGLIAMFTGGIAATVAGFLRCILIIVSGPRGAQQAGSWSCRESFIAVCVSNIPVIYPSITRILHRLGSGSSFSKLSGPGHSYQLGPTKEAGRRKNHSPYSIPNDTVRSSSDRIAMVPNASTKIETGDHKHLGQAPGEKDIRVLTEIDVESLQDHDTARGMAL